MTCIVLCRILWYTIRELKMNKNTSNVWVSINKNGQKILNIDNGKFVHKQNIDQMGHDVKYDIVQPKNN